MSDFRERMVPENVATGMIVVVMTGFFIYLYLNYDLTKISVDGYRALGTSAIWIAMGLAAFYDGFRKLRLKRTLQDIPTSKIGTGAVGTNVEIKGTIAHDRNNVPVAPVSGKPCAHYSIDIYRIGLNSNGNKCWYKFKQMESGRNFYLVDGSGKHALVYLEDATLRNKRKPIMGEYGGEKTPEIPQRLQQELDRRSIKLKKEKDGYLFKETYFSLDDEIYVFGHAGSGAEKKMKNLPPVPEVHEKFLDRFIRKARKTISNEPRLQKRYDTDKNGVLSANEMEQGAKIYGGMMAGQAAATAPHSVNLIFQYQEGHPYIISNKEEKSLTRGMAWVSFLSIFAGVTLVIICLVYLHTLAQFLPPK